MAPIFFASLFFLLYADIDQGIHKGKNKVEKNENKNLYGFSHVLKVWQILKYLVITFHQA